MMENLFSRYRRIMNMRRLSEEFRCGYAFVGVGGHSVQNFYPVIDYLHVPLTYICCRDRRKLPLIERKYRGVRATVELGEVLADEAVKGVFVSVGRRAHYEIAKRVLSAGKSLFIEKPPFETSGQLCELSAIEQRAGGALALVGLQKRYSPSVVLLRKRLASLPPLSYRYVYATGRYPEGDPLLELFIHPLDLVCHLFGLPVVKGFQRIVSDDGGLTLLLLLEHSGFSGIMELSTNYSWLKPVDELSVNTAKGEFRVSGGEALRYSPHGFSLLGVPLEKALGGAVVQKTLFRSDGFTPTLVNNQVYTQGYFSEIKTFVTLVEGRRCRNLSSLTSLRETYCLIEEIRKRLI